MIEVPRHDQRDFWIGCAIALFLLLCLFGCGGDAPPRPPPPQPPPPQAFPFYNGMLGLACTEAVPPVCTGASPWLTFDRPGTQGRECVMPGICYEVVGLTLRINVGDPGFPMIQNTVLDRTSPITLTLGVRAACKPVGTCYIGPVLYNGELNYRALYIDRDGIAMYGPTKGKRLAAAVPGQTYRLGLHYNLGTWTYLVNGVALWTETPGSFSADATELSGDPRPAIWSGAVDAQITEFSVR